MTSITCNLMFKRPWHGRYRRRPGVESRFVQHRFRIDQMTLSEATRSCADESERLIPNLGQRTSFYKSEKSDSQFLAMKFQTPRFASSRARHLLRPSSCRQYASKRVFPLEFQNRLMTPSLATSRRTKFAQHCKKLLRVRISLP